jgi:hypothetical protein
MFALARAPSPLRRTLLWRPEARASRRLDHSI